MKNLKSPYFIAVSWCLLLIIYRCIHIQHPGFLFMAWNLFLAWIPWKLAQLSKRQHEPVMQWLSLIGCLLFLPNAPYMLTDLIHLEKNMLAPIWYDLLLITSCACCGLLFFFSASEILLQFLHRHIKDSRFHLWGHLGLYFLCAYGIYIGRWLRLNSWDVFFNPFWTAKRLTIDMTLEEWLLCLKITIFYGSFLYVLHLVKQRFEMQKPLNQFSNN